MRAALLAVGLVLLVCGCASTGGSGPTDWTRSPVVVPFAKVVRGTTNVIIAPLDLPATVVRVSRETDNFGYALLAGGTEGVGNATVRVLAGAFEVVTFPLVYDAEPLYVRGLGERSLRDNRSPLP